MRPLQSIKTLFRTPFKTLITFLLLAVVMFAFFSRIAEYSVTSREMKNVAEKYRGIGSIENAQNFETYTVYEAYLYADPRMSQNYISSFQYQPLSKAEINSMLEA